MKKLINLLIISFMLCACARTSFIVEEFVGRKVEDVYAWCAELDDDHSCEVTYENNDEYEKDIVFEQSVKAGKKLKDTISFKVSSGKAEDPELVIPFIDGSVTLSDIQAWKDSVGLVSLDIKYETSDTVEKNHVIRLEPAIHITKNTPVTVYVSSGKAEPVNTTIEIKYGDYIGLSVEQFEAKAKELGLKPNHQDSRDKHDSNVKLGDVVWHGSGVYEKDEVFNYGICINQIIVAPGEYIGKSESDFIKIAKDLKLNPLHVDSRDAYSSKIDKGYIVTHGNGNYEENEDFKYGLSIGPAVVQQGYEGSNESAFLGYLEMLTLSGDRKTSYSDTVPSGKIISYNYGKYSKGDVVTYYVSLGHEEIYVDVPDFSGRSEDDLLRFLSTNGLMVASRSEQQSLIPRGQIVSNDTGRMKAGSSVSYTVSTGPAVQETAILEAFDTIAQSVSHPGDYEHAEYDMQRYLFGRGFLNYDIVPVVLLGGTEGNLVSITIDGERLGEYPQNVPLTAHIVCQIAATQN